MLTKNKPSLVESPKYLPPLSDEERLKEERMKDVLLLLENLVEREERTVKMILDCLYDVGSVNLINKKFKPHLSNRLMKSIARLSKPVFRIAALYWFKKNCPQLITDWLGTKVRF
jgi:hypothetical protein